jgi:hypothetical protein
MFKNIFLKIALASKQGRYGGIKKLRVKGQAKKNFDSTSLNTPSW